MEILERIWEIAAGIGNGILGRFERAVTGMFGSANARFLKRLQPKVEAISALEPKYQAMTDAELRNQTADFRRRLEGGAREQKTEAMTEADRGTKPATCRRGLEAGETIDDILVEAFAVCREGG